MKALATSSWTRVTLTRLLGIGAAALASLGLSLIAIDDQVVINASDSMPRGVYVRSDDAIHKGAIVTVRAREVAHSYARQRGFTDDGDRFLKRVAAVAGDEVCIEGGQVRVAGVTLTRAPQDAEGRILPGWSGCRALGVGEVMLLGETENSFDGRYWGPTRIERIEAVWRRL